MATARKTASNPLLDVAPWVPIRENDDGSVMVWGNPDTNESVTLPAALKPTESILAVARLNGSVQEFETGDESDEVEETAVDRILVGLDGSDPQGRAEIRIYRVRETGSDIYCGLFKPEEFADKGLELIRANFGGGKFRVQVMGTTPKVPGQKHGGKFVRLANQVVEIENSILPAAIETGGGNQNPNPLLMQMLDRMTSRIESIENRASQASADPLEMFEKFARIQKMLGGGGEKTSVLETIKQARELKKLGDEFGGDGDKSKTGDPLSDNLGNILDVVKTAMSNQNQQNQQARPTSAPPLTPVPSVSLPESLSGDDFSQTELTGENEVNPAQNLVLTTTLKILCDKAAKQVPASTFVVDLANKLPDEAIDMLDSVLWFEMMVEFFPEVQNHQVWFTELRDGILKNLDEPEGPNTVDLKPVK